MRLRHLIAGAAGLIAAPAFALPLSHSKRTTHVDVYFGRLELSGRPFNLASFVGATTVRKYVIGDGDGAPTSEELARMVALVDTAMQQGALGVSTSLIYAPASYAKTPELIALARAAARHGGVYASHIRNEADRIRPALEDA